MSNPADPQHLQTDQYRDPKNLQARAEIHRGFSTNPYGWFRWVFDALLKLPANAAILEIGCGPAYLWKDNAARIPPGWDITLSDLSPGMVEAQELAGERIIARLSAISRVSGREWSIFGLFTRR